MTEETKQETAIVKRQSDQLLADPKDMRTLAQDLVNSQMFPNAKSVPGVIAIIQAGFELGIPPVAALNTMAVINGRLALEAKALLAVAQKKAGVSWKVLQETNDICEMEFSRPGFSPITVSFTAKEAQDAGLLVKQNWKTYRRDMMFARCASRGIRRIAPDAVLGMYSREEMMDVATTLAPPPSVVAPEPSQPQKQAFGGEAADFFEQAESVKDAEIVEPGGSDDGFFGAEEPKPYTVKGPQPIQEPALFSDDVLSGLIDAIKEGLRVEGIDAKEYKAWLYHYQTEMKPARMFVGMKFGHPSFSSGDGADLKWLHTKLWDSVKKYKAWKRGQAK
jgi:hypothetical protein